MNDRAAEIVEAVLLLHSLGKPAELICSQLDLSTLEVAAIVTTGVVPKRQKTLFIAEPSERQKTKPVSRWEGVKRALEIHPPGKATNRQT